MAPSAQDPSHGNNARADHSSPSSNSTSTVGSKEKRTTATKSDEASSSIVSSFRKVFVNGVPLADYVKEDPHWNLLPDIATPCMECEQKRIECTVPAKYPVASPAAAVTVVYHAWLVTVHLPDNTGRTWPSVRNSWTNMAGQRRTVIQFP